MTTDNFKILEDICAMSEKTLFEFIKAYLRAFDFNAFTGGKNHFIAWGKSKIALIAHLDTVFKTQPNELFYDRDKKVVLASGIGAGFDDRAGIYAIIKILENWKDDLPTIIFTLGEEDYGVGAREIANMWPNQNTMKNLKYMIELDRKGHNDCVFYQCENNDFVNYIESFGFKKQSGSYTDIYFLMDTWNTCGVNLSIGYYNEHSNYEILHPDELEETIDKVRKMLKDVNNIKKFTYQGASKQICDKCNHSAFDLVDVSTMSGTRRYCLECLLNNCNYCPNCENLIDLSEADICPDCGEEIII